MEFGWPQEVLDFREEVRAFIAEYVTPAVAHRSDGGRTPEGDEGAEALTEIMAALDARGWLKRSWPVEYGGQGESPWFNYVLRQELRYAGIPYGRGAVSMIVPSILRFGSDAQKQFYVPKLWSGEISCALGYSEPDAGTDLASLQTRAVRDGDEYVINGQKIWTSGAHRSSHVWLAVRTDPAAPKHRGISVLIVPLKSPGIEIRPIWTMAGVRTNEVVYQDVRVPVDTRIGEENQGWYIIANALDHERVTVGIDDFVDLIQLYDGLIAHLKADHPERLSDPVTGRVLAEVFMELRVHRALLLTNSAIVAAGDTPTMEASMVKVWGSELRHRLSDRAMDLTGRYGALNHDSHDLAPLGGRLEATYRYAPVVRFAGGTNEVQRSIIAQRGLGLPR